MYQANCIIVLEWCGLLKITIQSCALANVRCSVGVIKHTTHQCTKGRDVFYLMMREREKCFI